MIPLSARSNAICAAPAGCGFLLAAEGYGLSPADLAQPNVALHLAAEAVSALSLWNPDHDQIVANALAHERRLRPLCQAVLSQPETAWWFGPLERGGQEWISQLGGPPKRDQLMRPPDPPDAFARRTQKPGEGFFTSTGKAGTSGAMALLASGYGDYEVDLPLVRYRIGVHPNARVFEVDGPAAWYQLCTSYPAAGLDGRVVPNWAAVADDWDGVHLTLGGLLTAEQVQMDGPAGWVEHVGWDTEQTVWLCWVFDSIERLPDVQHLPQPLASS
jgi:hypothetical protein